MKLDTEAQESILAWPLWAAPQGQAIERHMCVGKEEFTSRLDRRKPDSPSLTVGSFLDNSVMSVPQSRPCCSCPGGSMRKCAASFFRLTVNLLLPSPGLGVKCINILHEERAGVEAQLFFYFLPISF